MITTTNHRAAALTTASALAMYDAAECNADKLRAAAAMADVLRGLTKPKAVREAAAAATLTVAALSAVLKRASAVAERRNHIPILGHVLLEAGDDVLKITATDLDILFSETIAAPGIERFRLTAPLDKLNAALSGAKGEVVLCDATLYPEPGATFTRRVPNPDYDPAKGPMDGNWREIDGQVPADPDYALSVSAGGAEASLPGMEPKDFPVMVVRDSDPAHASTWMDSERIRDPLNFVLPAVSTEETRYYLNGVYMEVGFFEGITAMMFTSTDGSRMLHDRANEATDLPTTTPKVIIPRKSVEWLAKHLAKGNLLLEVWPTHIRVSSPTFSFLSKLIDGSFPDYNRVVPKDRGKIVGQIANPKEFAAIIKRLGAQTGERSASVKLALSPGEVLGTAKNMEGGKIAAKLPMEHDGASGEWGLNSRFMAEVVDRGVPVEVHIFGPADPVKLLYAGRPNSFGVIMPLRV